MSSIDGASNPGPNLNIVLVEPQIPPNTGNIIRLCVNTGCRLHLVGPMGFPLDDSRMRRAGLDYRERCLPIFYPSWTDFLREAKPPPGQSVGLSSRGNNPLFDHRFTPGGWLIFGSETAGLGEIHRDWIGAERLLKIPMVEGNRSLNLSNSVAIVVYEAWRQLGFAGALCGHG
ncbi:MAG: hypothetical protein RLY67_65 [Pseudomonadota bacterium]|jgi:tRNA (cytidine/uridine-2'-O-)-methyltransferase